MSDITPKPEGNVSHSYNGNENKIYSRDNGYWVGLSIANDGLSSLDFSLNGIRVTVNAGEVFEDNFAGFQSISIETTVAYRLVLRS